MFFFNRASLLTGIFLIPVSSIASDCSDILKHGVFNESSSSSYSKKIAEAQYQFCSRNFDSWEDSTSLDYGFEAIVDAIPVSLDIGLSSSSKKVSVAEACEYDWSKIQLSNSSKEKIKQASNLIVNAWSDCKKNEQFVFTLNRDADFSSVNIKTQLNKPILKGGKIVYLEEVPPGITMAPEGALVCSAKLSTLLKSTGSAISCGIKEEISEKGVAITFSSNYGAKQVFLSKKGKMLKPPPPRRIKPGLPATVKAPNGTGWGHPQGMKYCPKDSFAIGLRTRVEKPKSNNDDTALNAVQLLCGGLDGKVTAQDVGSQGHWGVWTEYKRCPANSFIASFTLRVEPSQGDGDDTAANNIKFGCRSILSEASASSNPIPTIEATPLAAWGSYGESVFCPAKTVVRGIDTELEPSQGSDDDTSANNIQMRCDNVAPLIEQMMLRAGVNQ